MVESGSSRATVYSKLSRNIRSAGFLIVTGDLLFGEACAGGGACGAGSGIVAVTCGGGRGAAGGFVGELVQATRPIGKRQLPTPSLNHRELNNASLGRFLARFKSLGASMWASIDEKFVVLYRNTPPVRTGNALVGSLCTFFRATPKIGVHV